jgi:hypothetical protein
MRGSAGSMMRIIEWVEISMVANGLCSTWHCFRHRIDPTLPRDGTDFMTLRVVMRIHVGCDSAAPQRRAIPRNLRSSSITATLSRVRSKRLLDVNIKRFNLFNFFLLIGASKSEPT